MALVLFLVLKLVQKVDCPYDAYLCCFLVALDSQTLLRWWLWKQSGR